MCPRSQSEPSCANLGGQRSAVRALAGWSRRILSGCAVRPRQHDRLSGWAFPEMPNGPRASLGRGPFQVGIRSQPSDDSRIRVFPRGRPKLQDDAAQVTRTSDPVWQPMGDGLQSLKGCVDGAQQGVPIRAPVKGATGAAGGRSAACGGFNPRPREGGDLHSHSLGWSNQVNRGRQRRCNLAAASAHARGCAGHRGDRRA